MQPTSRLAPVILMLALVVVACATPADTIATPTDTIATPTDAVGQQGVGMTPTPSAAVSPTSEGDGSTLTASVPAGDVLAVREVGRRPHDATAFTQGLEFDEGRLFESRGLFAEDESVILTEIDPTDGSTIAGRQVVRDPADGDYFAEGLTVVDDRVIQITWQSGIANVYDRDTFAHLEQFTYDGEGWGICDEPDRLIMSDGTSTLTFRDRDTFDVLGTVQVDLDDQPNDDLNELECVDGVVWANLWNTNIILVIDPDTGGVTAEVDVSSLADSRGRLPDGAAGDVLNGIAYDPENDMWLLTGKRWPWMFEVQFDCVQTCDGAVTPSHYIRPRPAGFTREARHPTTTQPAG